MQAKYFLNTFLQASTGLIKCIASLEVYYYFLTNYKRSKSEIRSLPSTFRSTLVPKEDPQEI